MSVLAVQPDFAVNLFIYMKKKIINQLRRRTDYVSKWQFVSMIIKAAKSIENLEPNLNFTKLFSLLEVN